jgi:hypothetical protein
MPQEHFASFDAGRELARRVGAWGNDGTDLARATLPGVVEFCRVLTSSERVRLRTRQGTRRLATPGWLLARSIANPEASSGFIR